MKGRASGQVALHLRHPGRAGCEEKLALAHAAPRSNQPADERGNVSRRCQLAEDVDFVKPGRIEDGIAGIHAVRISSCMAGAWLVESQFHLTQAAA